MDLPVMPSLNKPLSDEEREMLELSIDLRESYEKVMPELAQLAPATEWGAVEVLVERVKDMSHVGAHLHTLITTYEARVARDARLLQQAYPSRACASNFMSRCIVS
jgi:sigma54-dependent transcription regulator